MQILRQRDSCARLLGTSTFSSLWLSCSVTSIFNLSWNVLTSGWVPEERFTSAWHVGWFSVYAAALILTSIDDLTRSTPGFIGLNPWLKFLNFWHQIPTWWLLNRLIILLDNIAPITVKLLPPLQNSNMSVQQINFSAFWEEQTDYRHVKYLISISEGGWPQKQIYTDDRKYPVLLTAELLKLQLRRAYMHLDTWQRSVTCSWESHVIKTRRVSIMCISF